MNTLDTQTAQVTHSQIYCCGCSRDVCARLTNGREIYPSRMDLQNLPFWKCDSCKNYVGCHHKTKHRTRPLGVIANKEIKRARKHIHAILDPLWLAGKYKRKEIYKKLGERLGYEYRTAEIRCIDEARKIYKILIEFSQAEAI